MATANLTLWIVKVQQVQSVQQAHQEPLAQQARRDHKVQRVLMDFPGATIRRSHHE